MADKMEQINAGLARFYKQNKLDYPLVDGDGIFTAYCDENGLDEDGLDDELETTADQSLLVDFLDEVDDTFPFPDNIEGETEKKEFLFNIIQKCAKDPNAYSGNAALEVKPEHWNISKTDLASAKELYKSQLKTLFDAGMGKDTAILKLLAVGRKLNAPYLLYLADAYIRKKVDSGNDKMSVDDFARTSKHFKALSNLPNGQKIVTETSAGVKSFFARINPELLMRPSSRISADLEKTCELISSALDFVRNRARGEQNIGAATCPFQFDACFAFEKTENAFDSDMKGIGSDDDDDDDDDEPDEKKADEAKKDIDWFGDVQAKLKAEKLHNSMSKLTVESRGFIDPFKGFMEENGMSKAHKAYPHRRRFCALIDRRTGGAEDDLFFYEPPKNCDSFPEGEYVQLWYFDGPKTCILPEEGYGAAVEAKNDSEAKKKVINTGNACAGKMLTFSFHADAEDCIRCYMYAMGQMMRFMPEDIIKVLPKFFVADDKNTEWLKSGKPEALVKEMTPLLVDAKFDAFYKSC